MPAPNYIRAPRDFPAALAHELRIKVGPGGYIGLPAVAGAFIPVGTLPAGAMVFQAQADVKVAFGSGATIDIGTKAAPAGFVAALDVNTPGFSLQTLGTLAGVVQDETTVWLRSNIAASGAAAGAVADVVLLYYPNH